MALIAHCLVCAGVRRLRRSITAPPVAQAPPEDEGKPAHAAPVLEAADTLESSVPAAAPSPAPASARIPQHLQASSLLAVVAQLQEEVAVAESRRHEAEQEATGLQQTAADLRQQLLKVERQVAAKVGGFRQS